MKGKKRLIDLILLLCLVRPHFSFLPEVISVYLFDAVTILLIGAFNHKIYLKKETLYLFLALAGISALKLITGEFEADDLIDATKILYYYIVFYFLKRSFAECYSSKNIINIIRAAFIINVFVVIVQLFEIPGFAPIIKALYGTEKLRSFYSGYPRVYGTFHNANWFSIYLIFSLAFFLFLYETERKTGLFVIRVILTAIMLLVSGSRTGVIGAALLVLFYLIINKNIRVIIFSLISVITIAFLVFIVADKIPLLAKTLARFTKYFSTVSLNSNLNEIGNSRVYFWQESWKLFCTSPVLGHPLGELIPHNSYILFLCDFGLLGAVFFGPYLGSLFIRLISSEKSVFKTVAVSFSFLLIIVLASGDYLFCTQVMMLPIIIFSLLLSKNEIRGG